MSQLAKLLSTAIRLGPAMSLLLAVHPALGHDLLDGKKPVLTRTWTVENGLPQSTITCIIEARNGYLWLGTSGGLVRFDGVRFTTFKPSNTPALRGALIRALYEDGDGVLWIGAQQGGLTRYHRGEFRNYSVQDGLPHDSVVTITGDAHGNLWAGTQRGLARLHSGKIERVAVDDARLKKGVTALAKGSGDTLWVGTADDGVVSLKNGVEAAKYPEAGGVSALHMARDGTLWIGTVHDLARLRGGKLEALRTPGGRATGWIRSISQLPAAPSMPRQGTASIVGIWKRCGTIRSPRRVPYWSITTPVSGSAMKGLGSNNAAPPVYKRSPPPMDSSMAP